MRKLNKIPIGVSIHLRYLYQDKGLRGKELLKVYPKIPKATVYRHATKPIELNPIPDKRIYNKGRPRKLTLRERRAILRQIPILRKDCGSFSVNRVRVAAGITSNVCDETIRRVLHYADYGYYHSRKKGLLTKQDLQCRLRYARKVKRMLQENFWRDGISFYLDGAGFQHKYNPCDEARSTKTMAWRKRDEGLEPNCTAKGSHVGSGGNVAHFMVAIAYNKGVILHEQYLGRLNGEMFAKFITDHFEDTFALSANPKGKLFLQDGDPSQNSAKAKTSLVKVGARKFGIPARSPDMNPIENVFNYVKAELHSQALEQNITFENFDEYSNRVKQTLEKVPIEYINKTINTMNKRMDMVIKRKGKRIKY